MQREDASEDLEWLAGRILAPSLHDREAGAVQASSSRAIEVEEGRPDAQPLRARGRSSLAPR